MATEPTMENNLVIMDDFQTLPVKTIKRRMNAIQELMENVLKDGEHYGTIPGCGTKKALLQSGAEKLCVLFQFRPEYHVKETVLPNGHMKFDTVTDIIFIPTGNKVGQGIGTCSTMEGKYRYRNAVRKCPKCGVEAILESKLKEQPGWYCFSKKGGCGQNFPVNDETITDQVIARLKSHPVFW